MPTAAMRGIPAEKKKRNHKTQKQICILFISALNTQLHFQYGLNDELVWKTPSKSKDIHISDDDNDFLLPFIWSAYSASKEWNNRKKKHYQ